MAMSQDQTEEAARRALAGEPYTRVSADFGVSRQAIQGLMRRRGVAARKNGKLDDCEREEVVAAFQSGGRKPGEVGALYGVSDASVRDLLRRRGVEVPPTYVPPREGAFDDLSIPEVAYWIGFLFADGSVSAGSEGRKAQVSVGLAQRDMEHLEKLRRFLGSSGSISVSAARKTCQFSFRSEGLSHRLLALGRYSDELNVTLSRSRDFWRGVVDGDGSIGMYRRSRRSEHLNPQFRLVGWRSLLDRFREFLSGYNFALTVRPHKTIFNIGTTGRPAVGIVDLLYRDAAVALDRKAEAARFIVAKHRNGATDTVTVAAQLHLSRFVDMAI